MNVEHHTPTLLELCPNPRAWVLGGTWDGRWRWVPLDERPDLWYSADWLGLQQAPDFAQLPWLAIDWDNKEGNAIIARRIRFGVEYVAQCARQQHVVNWRWPSRTALREPHSAATHQFFWFADGSWQEHAELLCRWLTKALGQPVDWRRPQSFYALWGLDADGHFFFPDPDQGPIVMSLMPMPWIHSGSVLFSSR